jgi:signal transduction histidine kinase
VYAAPLLEAVRDFAPIDGIGSFLVDAEGRYLAHSERFRERPGGAGFADEHPLAAAAILGGAALATEGLTHFLARDAGLDTGWRFVLRVPESALDAASGDLREEYAAIIATVVLVTLSLAAATIFFVRLSARAVRLEEARRKAELEERLKIAERLGALGLITAGVAHEINNPLEGIGNYLALLEKESIPAEKRREHLASVRHGFARIRDIVRDLSSFSRPAPGDGSADLARIIERALRFASYDSSFREVEAAIDVTGALEVSGDEGRLEQVVLNLLLNAGKAMRGRGRVRVAARRLDGALAGWIEIAIEDSGPGIDPAHLERLFEPFFTTAEGSEGTGLGLAISRGIVAAHGGTIAAENRGEGGARFVVRLPAGSARSSLPSSQER